MRKLLVLLAAAACVSSCRTMSSQQRIQLEMAASRPVVCLAGENCEYLWSRALLWVTNHSSWKIRTQTDMLITTEGPFDTTSPAYEVQKMPLGNGRYAISIAAGCGNIFGCVPDVLAMKADFVDAMSEADRQQRLLAGEMPERPQRIPDHVVAGDCDALNHWRACRLECQPQAEREACMNACGSKPICGIETSSAAASAERTSPMRAAFKAAE